MARQPPRPAGGPDDAVVPNGAAPRHHDQATFATAERREATRLFAGWLGPALLGAEREYPRPGFSVEAVQTPVRVKVKCVTPLGDDAASTA